MSILTGPIDLDPYLRRIGYQGDLTPTLKTLQAIHLHHTTTIPFENLNSFVKQPVPLDLESLQHKLIHQKRGGYCFEQNLLLRSVLVTIGFQVTNLAARVLWNVPDRATTPRSHMLLQVDLDGTSYIADVGFGGLTLTAPLSLQPNVEQQTPHDPFRFLAEGQTYIMQARLKNRWADLYRFDLQEQYLPDYEVSNWYVSTHPNSLFVNSLLAARPTLQGRYALRNNYLTTYSLDGSTEHRTLDTVAEMRSTLEEQFQIQLPNFVALDQALQQVIDQSASQK